MTDGTAQNEPIQSKENGMNTQPLARRLRWFSCLGIALGMAFAPTAGAQEVLPFPPTPYAATPAAGAKTADEPTNRAQPVWYWLGTIKSEAAIWVLDPQAYTLNLADGQVAIQADCNRGSGAYTLQNDSLSLGPIALTRRACQPGSRGEHYAIQLQSARRVTEQNGVLQLDLGNDGGTMFFAGDHKARLYRYRCREGEGIDTILAPGRAHLWYGGKYYELAQVPSGSGVHYAEGDMSFHTKGVFGTLKIGDQIVERDCQMPSNALP